MSSTPPAEIAIGQADVSEEDCHGDLRQFAFLYRMAVYRLLNSRQPPCAADPGSASLDCPLPARG